MSSRIERLEQHGSAYRDPLSAIRWHDADANAHWLPPHLLSLAGLEIQQRMTPEETVRLSRLEFARLCAAGLWLEGLLISRVTAGGFPAARAAEARIMLQEVREESGHGLMFLEMIRRAGFEDVPLLGPTRLLTAVAGRLRASDAEFWAMVLIGESVTDALAVRAIRESRDGHPICPVARQVLELHHRDEARHIAAARTFIEERVCTMGRMRRVRFSVMLKWLLGQFLRATLYPTRESLAALGLTGVDVMMRDALACPQRRRLAVALAAHPLAVLQRGPMGRAERGAGAERA